MQNLLALEMIVQLVLHLVIIDQMIKHTNKWQPGIQGNKD